MASWSEVSTSRVREVGRLDAEYFDPGLLALEREIAESGWPVERFGDVVTAGQRAVYENTELFTEPDADGERVRFLQATDIASDLPAISRERMGWVDRADWVAIPQRAYPTWRSSD